MFKILHKLRRKNCLGICKWNNDYDIIELTCSECKTPMGFCWLVDNKIHTFIYKSFAKYRDNIDEQLKEFGERFFKAKEIIDTQQNQPLSIAPTCDGDEMSF